MANAPPSVTCGSAAIRAEDNEPANHGNRHIGLVTINASPETARIRPLTTGRGVDVSPVWSPDGTKIVYQRSDAQNPADLYVVDATAPGAKPVRLTDSLPAGVDRTRFVAPELVHYPGPDGKPVPAYLFLPKALKDRKSTRLNSSH